MSAEKFTEDEVRALQWAADRGISILKAAGWADMRRNAQILQSARDKLVNER